MWLLLGVFQYFLRNVRLLLKDINERLLLKEKNVQQIVLLYVEDCIAASRNTSVFFNERGVAFEKILNDCFGNLFKEKNVRLLPRIMST